MNCADKSISLNIKLGEDDEAQLENIIDSEEETPNDVLLKSESFGRMFEYLSHLTDREKLIIQLRFGLLSGRVMTLEEVSQGIGRTRERVRQIQNNALGKLKKLLEADI